MARRPTHPGAAIVTARPLRRANGVLVLPPTSTPPTYAAPVVEIPDGKPADSVAAWQPTIAYLCKVAAAEGIRLEVIRLHHHPKGVEACYLAESAWEDSGWSIDLCGRNGRIDVVTALHELAHLESEDGHGIPWVLSLYRLHRRWLPNAAMVRHADWAAGRESGKARTHWRRAYGTRWYGGRYDD